MAETFPPTLQELLNKTGFRQQFGKTTLESTVDVGPPKKRSRYTKGLDDFSCSIDMLKSDYTVLENFYKTTLNNGVNTFLYDHPLTGVETEFEFVSPPTILPIGGLYFRVDFVWREAP